LGFLREHLARTGLCALIAYLCVQAMVGRQGLIAYWDLQERETALVAESAALAGEIAELKGRTARLRTVSLDRVYLEEIARQTLNATKPGEHIFLLPSYQPAS
jgi:cell division protein FtsB